MRDWPGILIAAGMFLVAAVTAYAVLQLLFPWLPWPDWLLLQ